MPPRNEGANMSDEELVISFDTAAYDRERSLRTVLTRGRAYAIKRKGEAKHVSLHVYGTSEDGMRALVANFGGNYYPHQQGFQWQLAQRERLLAVAAELRDYNPEFSPNAQKRLALLLTLTAIEPESPVELEAATPVS